MQTNILMFFLGALTFYLISAITGELLDYFKIVDAWDYGEWYCDIPFVPFIFIWDFFKKFRRYILLTKLGFNPFGKITQFDDADNDTLKKVIDSIDSFPIQSYCRKVIMRRLKK